MMSKPGKVWPRETDLIDAFFQRGNVNHAYLCPGNLISGVGLHLFSYLVTKTWTLFAAIWKASLYNICHCHYCPGGQGHLYYHRIGCQYIDRYIPLILQSKDHCSISPCPCWISIAWNFPNMAILLYRSAYLGFQNYFQPQRRPWNHIQALRSNRALW